MVIREKYTAYSRTSDGSNVQIVNNQEVNWILWEELQNFFCYNYVIYKWSNIHCNDIYVGHTNNFEKRKQEHIKSCSNSKTKNHYCKIYQFIRASGGIDNWNMEILEEFYAGSRKEAEQIEQKWIDNLKPTLNICVEQVNKQNILLILLLIICFFNFSERERSQILRESRRHNDRKYFCGGIRPEYKIRERVLLTHRDRRYGSRVPE